MSEDLQAPRKQRHTARRVYDRLVAERGFKGSESIICPIFGVHYRATMPFFVGM